MSGLWSRRWFTDRAAAFGPATVAVIEQVLDRHEIEAQGYLDCPEHPGNPGQAEQAQAGGGLPAVC
ncbi:MAG: hypothetical protein V9G10_03745 [Candidatus Nanopelagicales bacterium]